VLSLIAGRRVGCGQVVGAMEEAHAERSKLLNRHKTERTEQEKKVKKLKGAMKTAAQEELDGLDTKHEAELAGLDKKQGTVKVVKAPPKDPGTQTTAVNVDGMKERNWAGLSKTELVECCEERGLSKKGGKEDLVMRLTIFYQDLGTNKKIAAAAKEAAEDAAAAKAAAAEDAEEEDEEDEEEESEEEEDAEAKAKRERKEARAAKRDKKAKKSAKKGDEEEAEEDEEEEEVAKPAKKEKKEKKSKKDAEEEEDEEEPPPAKVEKKGKKEKAAPPPVPDGPPPDEKSAAELAEMSKAERTAYHAARRAAGLDGAKVKAPVEEKAAKPAKPAKAPVEEEEEDDDEDSDDDDEDDGLDVDAEEMEKQAKREKAVQQALRYLLTKKCPEGFPLSEFVAKLEMINVKGFDPEKLGYRTIEKFVKLQPPNVLQYNKAKKFIGPPRKKEQQE